MKSGELYSSPLTFEDISQYKKAHYTLKVSDDIRETKRSETSSFIAGQVHEVGRITRGYILNRVINLSKTTTFFSDLN